MTSQGAVISAPSLSEIPTDISKDIETLSDLEPDFPGLDFPFSQVVEDNLSFSLKSFLRPYTLKLLISFTLVVITSLAQQAGPIITAYAIDHGIQQSRTEVLLWCFLFYVGTIFLGVLISNIRIRVTGNLAQELLYKLRMDVFNQLQRLSLAFYAKEKKGHLLTRMTSDIDALTELLNVGLINLAVQSVTLAVIIVCLFVLNPFLTLVLLFVVGPIMIVMTIWFKASTEKGYSKVRDRLSDVVADLHQNLAGVRTIVAFNRRNYNSTHHRTVLKRHRDAKVKMGIVERSYDGATGFISVIGQIAILLFGYNLVQNNEMTIGELIAFQLFLYNFFTPLQTLAQLYNGYQSGNAAALKIATLFSSRIDVPELPDAIELTSIEGCIRFSNVQFSYTKNNSVLSDLSFQVEAGESIAFVGATGSGKTTIAKLVNRLYDVSSGAIYVDGTNVKDVTFKSLRSHIGVVPQESELFSGSIESNISLFRPEISRSDVESACELLGILPFISRQSDGLDTVIAKGKTGFSAGEVQLISLARVFVANPRILILDEATANLDVATEEHVRRALEILLRGRTSIIIAHRISSIQKADRILFLEHGRIIEEGPHDELLRARGAYSKFYHLLEEQPYST